MKRNVLIATCVVAIALVMSGGCGGAEAWLNPAFVNTFIGGQFPVTPGPSSAYVLVRVKNETLQNAEFIVTYEQEVIEADDDGNFLYDDFGNPVTRIERTTTRLSTFPDAPANDSGLLVDCSVFPVQRIGLGETLLGEDAAVLIGGAGPGGAGGVRVTAQTLNPLSLLAGNFNCGDTVIFRAFRSTGVAGGVALQSFVQPGSEQPGAFSGPSTFVSYDQVLELHQREDEP